MKFVLTPFLCLLFLCHALPGQVPALRFKVYSTAEGLSNATVHDILQDKRGFMWIGTSNGLNRFDGYRFEVFRKQKEHTEGLYSNQISCLLEDQQGVLWIGTGKGLNYFLPWEQQFHQKSFGDSLQIPHIRAMVEDEQGQLWVGSNQGLWMLNQERDEWKHYPITADQSSTHTISALNIDSKGRLWVGTKNGIDRYDPASGKFFHYALQDKFTVDQDALPRFIFEDSRGIIWTGSYNSGLNRLDPGQQQFKPYPLALISEKDYLQNRIRDIHEDEDGYLWLATYRGIVIFHPDTGEERAIKADRSNPNSLSHEALTCFFEDPQGNFWIGSFWGGVNYFDKNYNNFQHYQNTGKEDALSYNIITGFAEDAEQKIWISAARGGLNAFDPQTGAIRQYRQKDPSPIASSINNIQLIESDPDGNLWLGTLYGGLHQFDTKKKQFKPIRVSGTGAQFDNIKSMYFEPGRGLWFSNREGLFLYQPSEQILESFNPLGRTAADLQLINCIVPGKAPNSLWLGTQSGEHGLVRINTDQQSFERYAIPHVNCLLAGKNGWIWAGTNGDGLYALDETSGKIQHYPPNGEFNGQIFGILEDESGNLWMSTPDGLVCFLPQEKSFRYYQNSDGIQGNQFKKNAYLKSRNGDFYFGGTNGFNVFNPAQIKNDHFLPNVAITNIRIGSKSGQPRNLESPYAPLGKVRNLTLKHFENTIFFDFVALNYSKPEKTQYAYQLEGFDEWNYIEERRNATYTNLSPGNYVFKIKATNGDGRWTEATEGLILKISPPPWKTWWAYVLYSLVLISTFLIGRKMILNRIYLKNELRTEQLIRKQEQELHEMKVRFFTNISHELRTPLTLILGPLEKISRSFFGKSQIRHHLHVATQNAERLAKLIDQLMDFRKLETDHLELRAAKGNLVRFVKEIFLSFKEHAKFHQIKYSFVSQEESIEVYFDRDKMEKVLFNLLSNAFKFTPPGKAIKMLIRQEKPGFVEVSVSDEGTGILPEALDQVFDRFFQGKVPDKSFQGTGIGLSLAKGFIELHQGHISVKSELGKGADFSFCLPLGCDHLQKEQIIIDFQDSDSRQHYLTRPTPVTPVSTNSPTQATGQTIGSLPKLLIVEDNQDIREFIAEGFSGQYQVYLADNGKSGYEQAIKIAPDLVISDVMMPEWNGIDLCSKLKKDFRTSHIPIILLSARTALIFKVNGLETGADDYLTKPFNQEILELKVRNLISSRRKLRERFRKEGSLNLSSVATTSTDEQFLNKIVALIEANLKNPEFNVAFLSRELSLSRAHLYRKIKALTDMTATEFIRSIRLRRASKILKEDPFLNINEVSYEVGIQDPSYFRKCFKQRYGLSPRKYRTDDDRLIKESS